jgi:3-deoxy-manno-octulosonate cytidylyltransferase (CMP-KDO synthetase)
MIERVYERARAAREVERVLVATDDERIASAVVRFGGEAVMTSPAHATGTDRLAEAAAAIEADIIVNVQGDEPPRPGRDRCRREALVDDPRCRSRRSPSSRTTEEMLLPSVVRS